MANGILVSAHPSWDKSRNEVSYLPYIVQVEPLRLLEVQLYGATLAGPLQRVVQSDVYLGPVERTVARVQLPRLTELVQGVGERLRRAFIILT